MRLTILIVCYSCVLLTGCMPAKPTTNSLLTSTEKGTKISFGVYDIAKSGPNFSSLFAPPEPLLQKGISPSQAPATEPLKDQPGDPVGNASLRSTSLQDVSSDRLVIKNAEMHLESKDPDAVQKVIVGIAEANSGFVLSTDQSMSDIT